MSKGLIVSIFLIILFSALACRLSGELVDDSDQIIILTEEAIAVNEKLEQAVKDAEQKGTFTLEITEQQLTSYVAINLASQSSIPITELQIRLRDGKFGSVGLPTKITCNFPSQWGFESILMKKIISGLNLPKPSSARFHYRKLFWNRLQKR